MNNPPHEKCMSEKEMAYYNSRMTGIINELMNLRNIINTIAHETKTKLSRIQQEIATEFRSIDVKVDERVKSKLDNSIQDAKDSFERKYRDFIEKKIYESGDDIEKRIDQICELHERDLRNLSLDYNRMIKIGKRRIELLVYRIQKDQLNTPEDHP